MRTDSVLPHFYRLKGDVLCLGMVLLMVVPATAQNLLKNGDFEQPLGPTNWSVIYLHGGPDDFEIKGRTRAGSRTAAWFGGYLRPLTLKLAHACFTQTVTNLSTNQIYTVSGWMREDWWREGTGTYDPNGDGKRDVFLVYIEAIGALGTPTVDGRAATNAVNLTPPTGPPAGFPDCLIYANGPWSQYRVQQRPDASGKIEVRLHYNKVGWTIYDKPWIMAASFDDLSLTP